MVAGEDAIALLQLLQKERRRWCGVLKDTNFVVKRVKGREKKKWEEEDEEEMREVRVRTAMAYVAIVPYFLTVSIIYHI